MLELTNLRKNKVNLSDYNCLQDIKNRMLMADFSSFDLEVLEEILFSPLKISIKKLIRTLDCKEEILTPILNKMSLSGLLSVQGDQIVVDKELRKYFEFQVVRFDPIFKPDMEFLQGLLRKVPIHCLPAWYSIPRTSNNIFESIVEKYLLTPQIYQRYLLDLNFGDLPIQSIISDLFAAPDAKLYSTDCITKYNLTRAAFEEILLLLEFNFIACLSYEAADDHWIEVITPFYEWHQYLKFLKATEPVCYGQTYPVKRHRDHDFAFIEDMSALLALAAKKPICIESQQNGLSLSNKTALSLASHCHLAVDSAEQQSFAMTYLGQVLQKLQLTQLICVNKGKIEAAESSRDWLNMNLENRALHLYRHPKNQILRFSIPSEVATERNIREAEKSIKRILHGNWVIFDEFLKSVLVTLSEHSVIMLKRIGKHWSYTLPVYGNHEQLLIKATIFEWLFEAGMVATGTCLGKECFAVTPFGRFFFEE